MLTSACDPRLSEYDVTCDTVSLERAAERAVFRSGGRRHRLRLTSDRWLAVCVMVACLAAGRSALAQPSGLSKKFPLRLDRPELVDAGIERAIKRGIQYLLSERAPEGHWESDRSSRRSFPCANTALVGLVLLADGNTPTRGEHARVVRDITEQLLDYSTALTPQASIFQASSGEYRPMYSHAFAMTFLASVFGQEGDRERRERIRHALRKGIELCRRAQSPDGGWGYHADWQDPEGTLVVTQLMGLRACREAGIPVSKSMIDSAIDFIRISTRPDGWVRYRAHGSREVRRGVTCATVVALWQAGEYDNDLTRRVRDRVLKNVQRDTGQIWSFEDHGEYVEYYLAQVMWIEGGELWRRHYKQIAQYLVTHQEQDGSWFGTRDSDRYGDIYATTMALLILQLPYKRLPIFQR